jgi:competence protein ComFC
MCGRCGAGLPALALPDLGWERLDEGLLAVAAYAYAGPMAQAVKHAKAPGGHGLGPTLAALLWERLGRDLLALPRTWVPSVRRAEGERALSLPRVLAGPGALPLLGRVGSPPDQTSLRARDRRRAPHGTFRPLAPCPPAILLVDDVRTTGATGLAAAAALRLAGAERVVLVTVALAPPQSFR